jgi:putative restriction endonuclease
VLYWWVNQNQTFRQEQTGGYLWSPKRNAKGAKNPFYETMREVSPGDIVFSFVDTFVAAIGVAQSYCWESSKPTEFGSLGEYWDNVGWKVRVHFTELPHRVRPKDHMGVFRVNGGEPRGHCRGTTGSHTASVQWRRVAPLERP